MNAPALSIPIRADISKLQQDMEKASRVANTAMKSMANNAAKVTENLLAANNAGLALKALQFSGAARSLAPVAIAAAAVAGSFKLMAYATELATQRIEEYSAISEKAARANVSTDFFQRVTKAGEGTKLAIDAAAAALERFNNQSLDKLGGSALSNLLGQHQEAGNLKGNRGLDLLGSANNAEERFRAIVVVINEALAKGERLAALDIADKAFGSEITERLRANSNYLSEMLVSADKMAATKIISDQDVANAVDLKRRIEEAEKILSEKWKPIQDDLAKLGFNYKESMVSVTETMASAVGYANQLYGWIKDIPTAFAEAGNSPFWEQLRKWSEARGLNATPESMGLTEIGGKGGNLPSESDAVRKLRAGLQDATAIRRQMAEAADIASKVFGDTSKPIKDATKALQDNSDEYDRAVLSIEKHIARLQADAQAVGLGAGALQEYRAKAALMIAAQQSGRPMTEALTKAINEQAEAAGRAASNLARIKLDADIKFTGDTLFFSEIDKQIASILRQVHGADWKSLMDGPQASALRYQATLREVHATAQDFTKDFVSGLMSGKSALEAVSNAAKNLASKLSDKAITALFSGDLLTAAVAGIGAAVSALVGSSADRRREQQRAEQERLRAAMDAEERGWRLADRRAALFDPEGLAGELARFERESAWQRLEESRAGNARIVELEQTLALERQLIVDNAAKRELEKLKQMAAEVTARQRAFDDQAFAASIGTSNLTATIQTFERV